MAACLRDFQTNACRDLNYVQQLLLNQLMFLLYIVNSGNFGKMANAVALLINDKHCSRAAAAAPMPTAGVHHHHKCKSCCTLVSLYFSIQP